MDNATIIQQAERELKVRQDVASASSSPVAAKWAADQQNYVDGLRNR